MLCVASILFLVWEISNASQRVRTDGAIRLVSFSFKTGRNFDELANSLINYRDCQAIPNSSPLAASNKDYIEKFDIVWSAFRVGYRNIYRHWADTGYWLDESRAIKAQELSERGLTFLDKYEADMSPDGSLSCSRINEMLSDIYFQKDQLTEFSQSYFELDNRAAQEQQTSMGKLFTYIAVLGASFLLMTVITIALVYNALKYAGQSLAKSVAAEQQAINALKDLSESKDANVAQKQFFAAASHDLRQPLHALCLYIGSLQRHVKSDEAEHILKCANMSADSLSALLDSLLDISRLDAGITAVNKDEFEVADLLSRLHDRFLPEVEEKGLKFILHTDDSRVFTDEQLLDRMLQNLISNAVAYTQSGQIELCCQRAGDEVLIIVSDTGHGIPSEEHDVVFDEFYRVAGSVRDRDRGLGLGLSIVKRLGDLLEASIALESREDVGTTITIKLPVANKLALAADTNTTDTEFNQVKPQPGIPDNLRVLVIDDVDDVRESTALLLETKGCVVNSVASAEAATLLCSTKEFEPEVVVSDYRLNGNENGMDAIKSVRSATGWQVPALLITGDTSINFATRREMVWFEVLYKPVDTRLLCERIALLARVSADS